MIVSDFLVSQNEAKFLKLLSSTISSKFRQNDIPSQIYVEFVYHLDRRSFEMGIYSNQPDTINETHSLSLVKVYDYGSLDQIMTQLQNEGGSNQASLVVQLISSSETLSKLSSRIHLHLMELCKNLLNKSSAYTISLSGDEIVHIYVYPYLDLPKFLLRLPALRSLIADRIVTIRDILGEYIPDFVPHEYDGVENRSVLLGSSNLLGFYFKWTKLTREHFLLYSVKRLDPTLTLAELPTHLETDPCIVETTIGRRIKLASQFFADLDTICCLTGRSE